MLKKGQGKIMSSGLAAAFAGAVLLFGASVPVRAQEGSPGVGASAVGAAPAGTGVRDGQSASAPVSQAAVSQAASPPPSPAAPGAISAPPVMAEATVAPTPGKGQPRSGEMMLQDQYSLTGLEARHIHDSLLLPIIGAIVALVLGLLLFIAVRFRRAAHPEPTRTAHNTPLEIVWTAVPALILFGMAVPSISLIARQYKPAPRDALTVKVTGYQWYWGYEYPDQGIPEILSKLSPPEEAVAHGEPYLLAADHRLVLPVGRPIRLIITAADVIHSFAVPSLWVKMDAVPGRLNEKSFTIAKPGVYYGQCSELCGVRHGFMPIAIEALPPDKFDAWARAHGRNKTDGDGAGVAQGSIGTGKGQMS